MTRQVVLVVTASGPPLVRFACSMFLLAGSCAPVAQPAAPLERTITVTGRIRTADGGPLPSGRLTLDPWWHGMHDWSLPCFGSPRTIAVDATGSFAIPIEDIPRNQRICVFLLSFEPEGGPWTLEEDRLGARRTEKRPIADRLDWGIVPLAAPSDSRLFANLSDEELEARIRASWDEDHHLPEPWNHLCFELTRRPGARWDWLALELMEDFRDPELARARHQNKHGQLELLTALRRRQGRPDPIEFEVQRAFDEDIRAPALPRLTARIANRDEMSLAWWGGSWRIEGRSEDGTPLPRNRYVWLGSTGASPVTVLEPWESAQYEIDIASHLLPFAGAADLRLTWSGSARIEEGLDDLGGLILFHAEPVRVDVAQPAGSAAVTPSRR